MERAESNSKQTREEGSVVDIISGLGWRSATGGSRSVELPEIPSGFSALASIHSHTKDNDASQMSGHHDNNSGDADHFGDFVQNVIVGPLGVGGSSGLCFYPCTSQKSDPQYQMRQLTAEKIVRQQYIRLIRAIESTTPKY